MQHEPQVWFPLHAGCKLNAVSVCNLCIPLSGGGFAPGDAAGRLSRGEDVPLGAL